MKLLQVNTTAGWGATGRIAADISEIALAKKWDSYIFYGRGPAPSIPRSIRIGRDFEIYRHVLATRLFDSHGLGHRRATRVFLRQVQEISPDIIHLHNIHGYYLNYPMLFDFIKDFKRPVVWTLHDCWPFTGHCAFLDTAECAKWKSHCHDCPQKRCYPSAPGIDRSRRNFSDKRRAFTGCDNITLVPVSEWLNSMLKTSFLHCYPSTVIHNGVDLNIFKPLDKLRIKSGRHTILGVASVWGAHKGLDEFVKLRQHLPGNYEIVLAGLSRKQIASLPAGILGLTRIEQPETLAELYNKADVFVNPTLKDNFPTTNLEALACGTPVIGYNTGGMSEALSPSTGIIVDKKDVNALADAIISVCTGNTIKREDCRARAENMFNKKSAFEKYFDLYESLTNSRNV